jgi:hypothetical protein
MVRKQIYVEKRQQALLRRLAHARGLSEAEIIRQAIDNQVRVASADTIPDPTAWDKARRFMIGLQRRRPAKARPRQWKREDAYEGRG